MELKMSDTKGLDTMLETAYSALIERRSRKENQVMSYYSRDVVNAINELTETGHIVTIGNLAEILGFGASNEELVKMHRLIADVMEEGVIYYSDGVYKIHPRFSLTISAADAAVLSAAARSAFKVLAAE
jgi:hypothetical protein